MKYDEVGIKMHLVQSMEYVDGRRSMEVNIIFSDMCISYADVPSFLPFTALNCYVKSC